MKTKLKPNEKEMKKFKQFFHPKGKTFFQTFPKHDEALAKPSMCYDTFKSACDELIKANRKKMEVGMLINETDGNGRKIENMNNIIALFVDLDNGKTTNDQIIVLPVQPHLIVETSPGKFHAYWLIKDCPVEQFKSVQQALAKMLNGDLSVTDASRVMRMAGTLNWKYREPVLATLRYIKSDAKPTPLKVFVRKMRLKSEADRH